MFNVRLRLPFLKIVRDILSHLNLASHQIVSNTWHYLFTCVALWPMFLKDEHRIIAREFLWIYRIATNPQTDAITSSKFERRWRWSIWCPPTPATRSGRRTSLFWVIVSSHHLRWNILRAFLRKPTSWTPKVIILHTCSFSLLGLLYVSFNNCLFLIQHTNVPTYPTRKS